MVNRYMGYRECVANAGAGSHQIVVGVSVKADRTTAHDRAVCGAVVRSENANYDRRALIICR